MDTIYPAIGNRRLISNSDFDALHAPCALVLDTNVVKDIGTFYFGSRKIDPELRQVLQYIRKQYQSTQGIFGDLSVCFHLGLTELSQKRNQGVNYSIFRNYGSAIVKLITCKETEFERICDSEPNRDYIYDFTADIAVDDRVAVESAYLPIYYGSVLYLLAIQMEDNTHKNTIEKSLDLFEQFYKWAHDELGFSTAFPTLLALYQLLGKDGNTKETRYKGNARHLTKFDPNKVTKTGELADLAWNSAWDMLFLMRLSDYHTGEVLKWRKEAPFSIPAALISKDYDPAWLSFTTNPLGEIITADGSTTLPVFESTNDFYDPYHQMDDTQRKAFWNQLNAIKASCSRVNNDPAYRASHSILAIHELEDRLGINHTDFSS